MALRDLPLRLAARCPLLVADAYPRLSSLAVTLHSIPGIRRTACTLQKFTLESAVMQRLASRVEQPFSVSIEAAGLAVFAHRTRFRDPGSLVQT
jgi:hypothetical protein